MKKFYLLALIAVVLLAGSAAWADGEFYVIAAGPTAVGTKITSLPYTITNPGFYYLTGNLTCSSGDGITVNADNVTIDLMGFTITGNTSSRGIFTSNSNMEIRNGTIYGCYAGIVGDGNNSRVVNVKLSHNAAEAIELLNSGNLIKDCSAFNTGPNTDFYCAMYVSSGTITGCVAVNNSIGGIFLAGPGVVIGNTSYNNTPNSYGSNFTFGPAAGGATAIMVDRNSAFGLNPNYSVVSGTTGVQYGVNAGSP